MRGEKKGKKNKQQLAANIGCLFLLFIIEFSYFLPHMETKEEVEEKKITFHLTLC
jgi:hypothetical protein